MFSVVCLSVCLQAGWGAGPTIQGPGWPIQGPDPTSPDKLGYHYTVKGPSPQTCSNLFNMKHSLSESGQLAFYSNAFLFLTSFSSALNPLAKWIGFEHRIKCHQKIKLHVFFFLLSEPKCLPSRTISPKQCAENSISFRYCNQSLNVKEDVTSYVACWLNIL